MIQMYTGRLPFNAISMYEDQIDTIFKTIGPPTKDQLVVYFNDVMSKARMSSELPTEVIGLSTILKGICPLAEDLITNMLNINPLERYNSRECLEHPFFSELVETDSNPFPKSPSKYDWSWYYEPANEESMSKWLEEDMAQCD